MNAQPGRQDSDLQLQEVLHEWKVTETLPPRFRERVWQRIAREETHAPAGWWAQFTAAIANALLRPSLAVSYMVLLLGAGLVAGYWQARVENAQMTRELGVRYVQMLDPYHQPHH